MMYGRASHPGSRPRMPAMPVPTTTAPSHNAIRPSNPRSNRSSVSGPGTMKKTKTQIGQWLNR